MADTRSIVKIFIGGPNDTEPLKEMLLGLIEGMKPAYKQFFGIDANSWTDGDDPPAIGAKDDIQHEIDETIGPAKADIVFMLFNWSLGNAEHEKNGKKYISSSVYEFETALDNASASVYVFKNSSKLEHEVPSPEWEDGLLHAWKATCREKSKKLKERDKYFERYQKPKGSEDGASPDRIFVCPFKDRNRLEKTLKNALVKELDRLRAFLTAPPSQSSEKVAKETTQPQPARDKEWPFRGIKPLDYEDAPIFFGRERDREILLSRMASPHTRFICIKGASGTGKSSLLRAGLLPALIANGEDQSSDRWRLLMFKPADQGNPFLSLASQLVREFGLAARPKQIADKVESACEAGIDEAEGEAAKSIVNPSLAGCPDDCELIVAVDQLEELWTLLLQWQPAFLRLLEALVSIPRVRVLVTLRADLADKLNESQTFVQLFNSSNSSHQLSKPSDEEFDSIICGLCDTARIQRGEGFLTQMKADAKAASDMPLPLVAHTLAAMHSHVRARTGSSARLDFTLDDYWAVGGVNGAIEKGVEYAMDGKVDKEGLARLFNRLVDMRDNKPVRVTASREQMETSNIDMALVNKLIEAPARVLVGGAGEGGDGIQLAHDALFEAWPDLRDWVERNRQDLEFRDELQRNAEQWLYHGKRPAFIKLRATTIEQIDALRDDSPELFSERPEIEAYLAAARLVTLREKLILSIKGGHITAAVDAARDICESLQREKDPQGNYKKVTRLFEVAPDIRRRILLVEHRGTDANQLRPPFWAVVTGDDRLDDAVYARRDQRSRDRQDGGSIFDEKKNVEATTSRGLTALSWAAVFGDLNLFRTLIDRGADFRRLADDRATLLHDAAYGGNLDIVKLLVETHQLPIDVANSDGGLPMIWAHQQGHWDVREYLLVKGGTLEFNLEDKWNVLTEAVRGAHTDEVRRLLESGTVEPDKRAIDGITPLHVACQYDEPDRTPSAELLIRAGADVEATTIGGLNKPLHWAAQHGHASQIKLLLSESADPMALDSDDETALHYAASARDRAQIIRTLVDGGADVDARNQHGSTPLIIAVVQGHHRAARALLAAGADPNLSGEHEWAPVHYAADDDDVAMLDLLISQRTKVEIDALTFDGWTPLGLAAEKGNARAVERLVLAGARMDVKQGKGESDALEIADRKGHAEVVERLKWLAQNRDEMTASLKSQRERELARESRALAGDRDPGLSWLRSIQQDRDEPPLLLAARDGNLAEVRALLAQGHINVRGERTRTALHVAAAHGHLEIAKLLLAAGISATDLDADDRTAADVADAAGHMAIAEAIVAHGAPEPALWSQPRVSDEAKFLRFAEPSAAELANILPLIDQAYADGVPAGHLPDQVRVLASVPREHRRIRTASLPMWTGAALIAVEDTRRKGPREAFVLALPGQAPVLLNWTNEPIYQLCERAPPHLDEDNARLFARFFFHFVRGVLGRFTIVDEVADIPWNDAASNEERAKTAEHVSKLVIKLDAAPGEWLMAATVVFKNALFSTDIRLVGRRDPGASPPLPLSPLPSSPPSPSSQAGQVELLNENLLLEDLHVRIDGPPGIYG